MAVRVTKITLKQPEFKRFTTAPGKPIYKHTKRLTLRVQSGAKRRAPVRKGRLRSSINAEMHPGPMGRVSTHVSYAQYIMRGTGVYGPRHAPIVPKRAKFLKFKPKGKSKFVYARSVKGIKPNPFLKNALNDIRS
jgi:hypothetical protein